MLEHILSLTDQADSLEKQIASLLKKFDPQLTSIPGIGTGLTAAILSEIGNISRFSSLDQLLVYAGLDPSIICPS
ncbi:transposase [Dysosmobacter sp. Sow4_B12]|uniref:transposase n=1 Tax=Dysosmobacter sp. Sow4_B12 TaxID=3438777 RepID=UPI003F8FAD55